MDKATELRINELHPARRKEVKELIEEANRVTGSEITIRLVQGFRTFSEQNGLYAQGRTKPGKKVTNSKAGQSFHNYGLAIDFAFLVKDKGEISWDIQKDWDNDKIADWLEVVQIFLKAGWVWGGNFKSIKDNPHFEKSPLSWKELLKKYNEKETFEEIINGKKFTYVHLPTC